MCAPSSCAYRKEAIIRHHAHAAFELGELARTEDLESGELIYSLGPFANKPATTAAGDGFPWTPKQFAKRNQRRVARRGRARRIPRR